MANFVPLDFTAHRLLRLSSGYGHDFGDNIGMVSVVPTEIPSLVCSYPLFFRKTPAGSYELGAMLGFAGDENLFLDGARWDAGYVPLNIRCQPFAVRQSTTADHRNTLLIDANSPRLASSTGDVLFFADGRPSERLQSAIDMLEHLTHGVSIAAQYVAALDALDLIEPVEIRVDLGEAAPRRIDGLYAINADGLRALPAPRLAHLHEQGFLQWAFLQAASVGQIANLTLRKCKA